LFFVGKIKVTSTYAPSTTTASQSFFGKIQTFIKEVFNMDK